MANSLLVLFLVVVRADELILTHELILNQNHHQVQGQLYHHVQGQLYITGTECCDFIIWTTKDLQVIRIIKDKNWASNIPKLIDFYFKIFISSL